MRNWKKESWSESPHTGNWLYGIFLKSNDPLKMWSFLAILFLHTSVHHMFSIFVVAFSPLYAPSDESFAEMYLKTKVQTAEWKPSETLAPLKLISLGKFHKNSPEKKKHIAKCWTCLTLFFFDLHFSVCNLWSFTCEFSLVFLFWQHLNWWCVDTNTEKTRLFFFFVVVFEFSEDTA